jgi:hypothetical protein
MPATFIVLVISTVTIKFAPVAPTIAAILQLLISQTSLDSTGVLRTFKKKKRGADGT